MTKIEAVPNLRRKPPYLSLAPLIPWRSLERPVRWDQVFGRVPSIHVEIGFGLGDFLVRSAKEQPEKDFVGMEVGWPMIRRTLKKIALSGVKNVAIIRVDARVGLQLLFQPMSIQGVYALFPCPWPKSRHMRFRLFSNDFLKVLNSRLVMGADVIVVTDHTDYLHWLETQVPETRFEIRKETIAPQFATKYEKKWHRLGRDQFYKIELIKTGHTAIPEKGEIPVQSRIITSFDPKAFELATLQDEVLVTLKDFLYDSERQRGMVRALITEEPLTQEIWIEILREENGWTIKPAKGCAMVPTAGVQRAIDFVRDMGQAGSSLI